MLHSHRQGYVLLHYQFIHPPKRRNVVCFFQCLTHTCCSVTTPWPTLQPRELHGSLPCPSLSPGVCSNSCALIWCCHPTSSSSVALFSYCPQSLPASGSFPMNWFFTSSEQSIGASASASVIPRNIQG